MGNRGDGPAKGAQAAVSSIPGGSAPVERCQVAATFFCATIRASPTTAPDTMAQAAASGQVTSGCSGFAGGSLPVAVRQANASVLRASKAPTTVASISIALYPNPPASSVSLSAMPQHSPVLESGTSAGCVRLRV